MHQSTPNSAEILRRIARGSGRAFNRVHFKDNRVRLLSISKDGTTLYLHAAFRAATPEVVDVIAAFLRAAPGSDQAAAATRKIREWVSESREPAASSRAGQRPETATTGARATGRNKGAQPTPQPGPCCATSAQRDFLTELYREIDRTLCGGTLPPDLFLRFSSRMRRRLGHVRCYKTPAGERRVAELALNIDLMKEGNEDQLLETMLHEVAHIIAWIEYGDRGHGAAWKGVARRLGCRPRACTTTPVPLRRRGSRPTTRVPRVTVIGRVPLH